MIKNELQRRIMLFISRWANENDVPIPRKMIVDEMIGQGTKSFTAVNALNSLLKKGYIRRSIQTSNKTSYVKLRGI